MPFGKKKTCLQRHQRRTDVRQQRREECQKFEGKWISACGNDIVLNRNDITNIRFRRDLRNPGWDFHVTFSYVDKDATISFTADACLRRDPRHQRFVWWSFFFHCVTCAWTDDTGCCSFGFISRENMDVTGTTHFVTIVTIIPPTTQGNVWWSCLTTIQICYWPKPIIKSFVVFKNMLTTKKRERKVQVFYSFLEHVDMSLSSKRNYPFKWQNKPRKRNGLTVLFLEFWKMKTLMQFKMFVE